VRNHAGPNFAGKSKMFVFVVAHNQNIHTSGTGTSKTADHKFLLTLEF
jgi:hypothetical protein